MSDVCSAPASEAWAERTHKRQVASGSIGQRLAWTMGFVLSAALLASAVAWIALSAASRETQTIMQEVLATERLVSEWERHMAINMARATAMVVSGDAALMARLRPEVNETSQRIAQLQGLVASKMNLASEQDLFARLGTMRERYIAVRDSVLELVGAGHAESAQARFRSEFMPAVAAYSKAMEALRCNLQDQLDVAAARISTSSHRARQALIGFGLIAVVCGISMTLWLTRAVARLHASDARYRSVIASMADGLTVRDLDGHIVDCNTSAERIFEQRLADVRGQPEFDTAETLFDTAGQPLPRAERPFMRVLRSARTQAPTELAFRNRAGRLIWLSVTAQPLIDSDGSLRGVVSTFADITARREAAELQRARDAAEAANQAKSVLLTRMSHELRTPLNAVLGFAQILKLEPSLHALPRVQAMLEHIHHAGTHLLDMINELLDLSRIEAGALVLRPETFELCPLIQECLALVEPGITKRRLSIDCRCDHVGSAVTLDRRRCKQVVLNLLSNAVKYNRDEGRVIVRLRRDIEHVELDIGDTGTGLDPDQLANLFQPFNRLGATDTGVEGTGLGLVITRQLMEAMGAEIKVQSQRGQGTRFTLRFPFAPITSKAD